jgi:hypothetical protein
MLKLFGIVGAVMLAAPEQTDDGFAAFWADFQKAAAKGDKTKIVSMCRFPLLLESREAGVGEKEFRSRFADIFDDTFKAAISGAKPVNVGVKGHEAYQLSPKEEGEPRIFIRKKNGEWKITVLIKSAQFGG